MWFRLNNNIICWKICRPADPVDHGNNNNNNKIGADYVMLWVAISAWQTGRGKFRGARLVQIDVHRPVEHRRRRNRQISIIFSRARRSVLYLFALFFFLLLWILIGGDGHEGTGRVYTCHIICTLLCLDGGEVNKSKKLVCMHKKNVYIQRREGNAAWRRRETEFHAIPPLRPHYVLQ